jgi:hypothetical protein
MIYTLNFISRIGLWELAINNFRCRFYATRYPAEKLVARYRRATQARLIREEEQQQEAMNNGRFGVGA